VLLTTRSKFYWGLNFELRKWNSGRAAVLEHGGNPILDIDLIAGILSPIQAR